MIVTLAPVAGEAVFADPAMVGEWAAHLPTLLAGEQRRPWCTYIAKSNGKAVRMGGFKGPPDESGWVEIAYLTFLPEERRGVATAVAGALLMVAFGKGARGILAHTLPASNPSARILEANGFRQVGEVIDPDDGVVGVGNSSDR